MSLDIVALRKMVWKAAGFETDNEPELTRDEIDLYLNRAFWELMDKFNFREKEKTGTFPLLPGVNLYAKPVPTEAIKQISVIDEFGRHYDLIRVEAETYESMFVQSVDEPTDDTEWADPTHYLLESNCFRVWPTPKYARTAIIRRLIMLTDLSVTNTTPTIPQAWHELIGWGGLWRALLDLGDYNRSNMVQSKCIGVMNSMIPTEIKEKTANTRMAGLQVFGRDYDQEYDVGYER